MHRFNNLRATSFLAHLERRLSFSKYIWIWPEDSEDPFLYFPINSDVHGYNIHAHVIYKSSIEFRKYRIIDVSAYVADIMYLCRLNTSYKTEFFTSGNNSLYGNLFEISGGRHIDGADVYIHIRLNVHPFTNSFYDARLWMNTKVQMCKHSWFIFRCRSFRRDKKAGFRGRISLLQFPT